MWLNRFWAGSWAARRSRAACSGRANADSGCRPLTLLLCFIEAIEVAFPGDAPRIFLGVSSLRGQRGKNGRGHRDRGKGRKTYHLRSDDKLGLCRSAPGRKTQARVSIFPNMPILTFANLPARQTARCVHGRAGHFRYWQALVSDDERAFDANSRDSRRFGSLGKRF